MDITTGKIRELKNDEEPVEYEVELARLPDPKCRRCYGLGHLGRNLITKMFIICKCVKKRIKE